MESKLFKKYILNALNHHFIAQLKTQFSKNTSQSILYKFAERATGQVSVIDAQFKLKIINLELTVTANNLFNTSYIETGALSQCQKEIYYLGCVHFSSLECN